MVQRINGKMRRASFLVVAMMLFMQALPQAEAVAGLFLPALNVADIDGDGENILGLTGLAARSTNLVINAGVGGALRTGADVLGHSIRSLRANQTPRTSVLGRRFVGAADQGVERPTITG
jgi:hypothetical protein